MKRWLYFHWYWMYFQWVNVRQIWYIYTGQGDTDKCISIIHEPFTMYRIKFMNVWLMLKDQMPVRRFWRNLVKGHIRRKFNWRSHARQNGTAKVMYGSHASVMKAKIQMEKKYPGKTYSGYKCVFCDGYHLGGNVYRRDKK